MPQSVSVQPDPSLSQDAQVADCAKPLVVDLDGTLLASDSMQEAILLLARSKPLDLVSMPFWLAAGRAFFKDKLFSRAMPEPAILPYRPDVLEFLRQQKQTGRRLILATGSDRRMADAVARHLGIFDEVLASDGRTNLTRQYKLAELETRFGKRGFDYMGNSAADLCLWEAAGQAYVVSAPPGVLRRARAVCTPARVFAYPGAAVSMLRALRPHQWVKNLLLFVPLLLAHRVSDPHRSIAAIIALFAMSLCASSVYILNDLLDLESDRRHPNKRNRPFAAGKLMPATGLLLMSASLAAGLALSAALLPGGFTFLLLVYFAATFTYSFWIKRLLLIDVIMLAVLYTLRIIAGAAAVQVPLTMWLLAFSLFFFVSLAFAKRYAELLDLQTAGGVEIHGRGYTINDLRIIESVGPASGYLSVMLFCLYLDSDHVRAMYIRHELLWLATPIFLYWITRIWFLARRRALHQDPILFAIRDWVSYAAGLLLIVIVLAASVTFHGRWGRWPLPPRERAAHIDAK